MEICKCGHEMVKDENTYKKHITSTSEDESYVAICKNCNRRLGISIKKIEVQKGATQ